MKTKTIKCPNCGREIRMDETEYAVILQQVQNAEFEEQVKERVEELQNHLIEKQNLELEKGVNDALQHSEKLHKEEINALQEKMQSLNEQLQAANGTIQSLNAQAKTTEEAKELAVLQATTKLREEMDSQRVSFEEKLATEKAKADAERTKLQYSLDQQKEQTEFYRDLKTKMNNKIIGETLEQHCQISFDSIRMTAFPNAEFGKDNDARSGSKGDFIFREKLPDSDVEILSIMFEMKNQMDTTATKHKNEDFFAELDKDRREKNCEYAVLVSLLEIDNELYNAGIVDGSYKYPKMYVVRPQCFLTIIGLLRNASLGALDYKRELANIKAQNIDVSDFEKNLLDVKMDFGSNVEKAGKKFQEAINGIDKTITQMQKIKDALMLSNKHLIEANNKVDRVTVKKLTKNNKTVQRMMEEAKADRALGEEAIISDD